MNAIDGIVFFISESSCSAGWAISTSKQSDFKCCHYSTTYFTSTTSCKRWVLRISSMVRLERLTHLWNSLFWIQLIYFREKSERLNRKFRIFKSKDQMLWLKNVKIVLKTYLIQSKNESFSKIPNWSSKLPILRWNVTSAIIRSS